MSRDAALASIARLGDQRPDADIARALAFMDLSPTVFAELEERFRGHAIWQQRDGQWVVPGCPVADWRWPRADLEQAA